MSKFTRTVLRVPRLQSLFGFISLQTGTELISLALVFNKVIGLYGLLAILTGFQLSLLQLGTYVYSLAILGALVYLIPTIRKQKPWGCFILAWVYSLDTALNTAATVIFGLEWYFTSGSAGHNVVTEGSDNIQLQGGSSVMPHETAFSMVAIIVLTLLRVYFSFVVMAYARQVLQAYMMQRTDDENGKSQRDGPFSVGLPNGEGKRGKIGRLMVRVGRGYWLGEDIAMADSSGELEC